MQNPSIRIFIPLDDLNSCSPSNELLYIGPFHESTKVVEHLRGRNVFSPFHHELFFIHGEVRVFVHAPQIVGPETGKHTIRCPWSANGWRRVENEYFG